MSLEQALERNNELLSQLVALLSNPVAAAPPAAAAEAPAEPESPPPPQEAEAPKPKKAKAEKPKAEPKVEEPKAAEPEADTVTRADVSAALTLVSAEKGRAVAMSLLAEHGGKALGEVPEANYGKLRAACEAMLNG